MSEMVERVARAIYEQRNGFGAKPWGRQPASHREPYLHDAKAALKAAREPTTAMLRAGSSTWDEKISATEPFPHDLGTWRAMIDEALR